MKNLAFVVALLILSAGAVGILVPPREQSPGRLTSGFSGPASPAAEPGRYPADVAFDGVARGPPVGGPRSFGGDRSGAASAVTFAASGPSSGSRGTGAPPTGETLLPL